MIADRSKRSIAAIPVGRQHGAGLRGCRIAITRRLGPGIDPVGQSVMSACEHHRQRQIGIGIGARDAMLDPARGGGADRDAQRHGAIVDAPVRRGRRIAVRDIAAIAVGVRRKHRHRLAIVAAIPPMAWRSAGVPSGSSVAKMLTSSVSITLMWTCMPEPALSWNGLAMNVASQPSVRATPLAARLNAIASSAAWRASGRW